MATPAAGDDPAEHLGWLRRPHSRVWIVTMSVLGVLALVGVCGLSSWFIVEDERQGVAAAAPGDQPPVVITRDISSRQVDPAPLTVKEVFPAATIVIQQGEKPYRVLGTQLTDCRKAADGEIATLLADLGCTQLVRATMRSPSGSYLITGGILNLDDAAGAEWARTKVKTIVDSGDGRFHGMVAGQGTEPVALSSAHVAWDVRGHYLVYVLVARADRKEITADDPYVKQIRYDILFLHLQTNVLDARATTQPPPLAATTAPR